MPYDDIDDVKLYLEDNDQITLKANSISDSIDSTYYRIHEIDALAEDTVKGYVKQYFDSYLTTTLGSSSTFNIPNFLDTKVPIPRSLSISSSIEVLEDLKKEISHLKKSAVEDTVDKVIGSLQDSLSDVKDLEKHDENLQDELSRIDSIIQTHVDEDEDKSTTIDNLEAVLEKYGHIITSQGNEIEKLLETIKLYKTFSPSKDVINNYESQLKAAEITALSKLKDSVNSEQFSLESIGITDMEEPAKTALPKFARFFTKILEDNYQKVLKEISPVNNEES